jgi:hypothetical protein
VPGGAARNLVSAFVCVGPKVISAEIIIHGPAKSNFFCILFNRFAIPCLMNMNMMDQTNPRKGTSPACAG